MTRPPLRGRPWTATDRTGGPLDQILDQLRAQVPSLIVERLQQKHAGDDNDVYFIGDASGLDRVQIDTAPGGQPPFLIEADRVAKTNDPAHAATLVRSLLTASPNSDDRS